MICGQYVPYLNLTAWWDLSKIFLTDCLPEISDDVKLATKVVSILHLFGYTFGWKNMTFLFDSLPEISDDLKLATKFISILHLV